MVIYQWPTAQSYIDNRTQPETGHVLILHTPKVTENHLQATTCRKYRTKKSEADLQKENQQNVKEAF